MYSKHYDNKQQQHQQHVQIFAIMSSQDTESFRKLGKFLENLDILFKGVSETIKNEAKEQNKRFLSTLIGASLLGNMLAGKVALLKMIELSKLLFVLVRIAEEQ